MALGSVAEFCRGFGVGGKKFEVWGKFEAGFGVGAKTGWGVGRGGDGEEGCWRVKGDRHLLQLIPQDINQRTTLTK